MSEFDYIIVGGGSAGCVLANRLSEDPNTSVCLVEAGGSHRSWLVEIPLAAIFPVSRKIKNWAFSTRPQKGLNGRKGYQPRGKVLGGSSSINAMIYTRGHPADYNHWAELGNKGWSWKEVLPYFKKAENHEAGPDEFHGVGGPLNVAHQRDPGTINSYFLDAAQSLQIPLNEDFNGADQEGVGYYEVTQKNGSRWSAAHAYLDPSKGRENLTVLTNCLTEKVTFEGTKAKGIRIKRKGRHETIEAKKEVILSAGAFGSPHLLLLSGVGAKSKLAPHAIDQVCELPGVGDNLQDHLDWIASYRTSVLDTVGISFRGTIRLVRDIFRYFRERKGILTSNYAESGGFIYLDRGEPSPDIQLHFVRAAVDNHGRTLHLGHGYSCHVCLLRPKSRGSVSLQSANPAKPPIIDPNYLSEADDFEKMVTAVKKTQAIMQAPAFDPVRGKAFYGTEEQDEQNLRKDIRDRADTIYHPVGTCKMGNDAMAVVDDHLCVHGVQGLRVVDASVMPTIISGNTNAPTIMIAEKAADMIKAGKSG